MSIRVGRIAYIKGRQGPLPQYPDHSPIVCLTASSPYGSLSPYELRDDQGRCIENLWQFAKVYPAVPEIRRVRGRRDQTVVFQHPAETHVTKDLEILPAYWAWRAKGMSAPDPIRYPVTYDVDLRASCLGALWRDDEGDPQTPWNAKVTEALDYISARKRIYVPLYEKYVTAQPQFRELVKRVRDGENLLILEVDGPHQESMQYYKERYGCTDDFIKNDSVAATHENLHLLLNDPLHPYGHGYCLAKAMLNNLHS